LKSERRYPEIQRKIKTGSTLAAFVSAIDFWKKDTSPDFEKTDIFIEKTIDTGFELMDNEPLEKFSTLANSWKEKFKMS
jgi:ubiquinone biosynthesis protein COQ9